MGNYLGKISEIKKAKRNQPQTKDNDCFVKIMNNDLLPKWNKWILVSLLCYRATYVQDNVNVFKLNEKLFKCTYNLRPKVFINGILELSRKGLIKYDNNTNIIELCFEKFS